MLPPCNGAGELPPGVHVATWSEVKERFCGDSAARARALATLQRLHALASRTGELRRFFIFGSFVSAAPEPRDVDVLLLMSAGYRVEQCPWEARALFSHAAAQRRYGASVFWLREGMLPDAGMRDFLLGWQTRRDGKLRGILEVA
jgi:hypothetical protein